MKNVNALAELAERLTPKEVLNTEGRAVVKEVDFDALVKAQRIVAEVAKVKLNGVGWPRRIELADAYENCRAIAEEGDGK